MSVVKLFQVAYTDDSAIGLILAVLSLFPVFYLFHIALSILTIRRDLNHAFLLAGFLLNEVVNYALKHTIREPRPDFSTASIYTIGVDHLHEDDNASANSNGRHDGYGMPSSHAQFMSFLFMLTWLRKSGQSWLYFVLMVGVCLSRVHLEYHTWEQVSVGTLVGLLVAFAYRRIEVLIKSWLRRSALVRTVLDKFQFIDSDGLDWTLWEFKHFYPATDSSTTNKKQR